MRKHNPLYSVDLGSLDGLHGTVTADIDEDFRIEDDGDWFGRFTEDRIDGSSCKMDTRSGPTWWTPPTDIVRGKYADPAQVAHLRKLVQGYLDETIPVVGVTLTLTLDGFTGSASVYGVWLAGDVGAELVSMTPDLFDDAFADLQANIEDAIGAAGKARTAQERIAAFA